ncbi:MAG: hypothetical protein OEW60_00330 [Thiovulaceae bacterium]|nr:hypothetical protein [Sulfurimonadaceae bacterium]
MRHYIISTFHSAMITFLLLSSLGCATKGDPFYKKSPAKSEKNVAEDSKNTQQIEK